MNNVGIIGYGFVGKAVSQLSSVADIEIYDPNHQQYNSIEQKVKAYNCDIIFINVPTNLKNGKLDLSIIDDCLLSYGNHHFFTDKSTIVIICQIWFLIQNFFQSARQWRTLFKKLSYILLDQNTTLKKSKNYMLSFMITIITKI